MRSFRLRLALSVMLTSGIALAAFGGSAYYLLRNAKIDRVESALRLHAERELLRMNRQGVRSGIEADLDNNLGLDQRHGVAVLLQESDGTEHYRSPHWPRSIEARDLPWFDAPPAHATSFNSGLIPSALAAEMPLPATQWGPDQGRPSRRDGPPHGRDRPPFPPPHPPAWSPTGAISPSTAPPPAEPAVDTPPAPPPASTNPVPDARPSNSSGRATEAPIPVEPESARLPPPPRSALVRLERDGQQWRLASAWTRRTGVSIALNLVAIDDDMRSVRNAFLLTLPVALTLIGIGAWLITGTALRPIRKLTRLTREVTTDALDRRLVPEQEDHEFAELIDVFNRMLMRLERGFKQAQRFSADAAHELKTPLAILQGQLERAVQSAPDGSALQGQLASMLGEVQRLATISRKLLLLSQADTGTLRLHSAPLDLSAALRNVIEDAGMLAPDLSIQQAIAPELVVKADDTLLTQVFHNLISNAIKYNIPGGWIRVAASGSRHQVEIQITNSSRGIPHADRDHLFERFFRADAARNRAVDGVGLGLALSREIVRAHQGTLSFEANDDGQVTLRLCLPAAGMS